MKSYNRMSYEEFIKAVRKDRGKKSVKSYGEVLNDKVKKKLKKKGVVK